MESEVLLFSDEYLLQKMPGKGGWTYAILPPVPKEMVGAFGQVKIKGTIDSYVIKSANLMPMGNGSRFLPVKAEIRKKIGKQAGDYVQITLYLDKSPFEIPQELIECLQLEPGAYETFVSYSQGEQKLFIDWIYGAKREETKADRIAKTLIKLEKKEKLYNQ